MRALDSRLCRLEAVAPVGQAVFAWEPDSGEELAKLLADLGPGYGLVLLHVPVNRVFWHAFFTK